MTVCATRSHGISQAKGPVSWRKEIFEGIEAAAKVVLFVDSEFLLSFNCLQILHQGFFLLSAIS